MPLHEWHAGLFQHCTTRSMPGSISVASFDECRHDTAPIMLNYHTWRRHRVIYANSNKNSKQSREDSTTPHRAQALVASAA